MEKKLLPPIPKKFIPLIIAAAAGILAMFLINSYLAQQTEEARKRAQKGEKEAVTVIVAGRDLPAGTVLDESMLQMAKAHKSQIQPAATNEPGRVIGKVLMAPVAQGEQIQLNKLTVVGEVGTLSMRIPPGKRAITVTVDNIASVGGMIRPMDRVDVVGVVPLPGTSAEGKPVQQQTTMPLFQNVTVLAVGQEFGPSMGVRREEKSMSPDITLALSPQEANLIAFVQDQGKIRLILRSPQDTSVQPVVPASWDTLLRTVMPERYREAEEGPIEEYQPSGKKVEIYRGLQREDKYLK
ncbi:MAG: Flp pilus assembly protein CpaB [Candidatus Omnitrophica bacterium]|nr:Flp pilus assembly protein CpaB [Candidatus Omnitrophota bacterium]